MILITFSNNETLEFQDRFTALVTLLLFQGNRVETRVVKLRCNKSSDYMAIQDYLEMLKLIAKT